MQRAINFSDRTHRTCNLEKICLLNGYCYGLTWTELKFAYQSTVDNSCAFSWILTAARKINISLLQHMNDEWMMLLELIMVFSFLQTCLCKMQSSFTKSLSFESIRQIKEQHGPRQGSLAVLSSYVLIMPMIISLLCDLHGLVHVPNFFLGGWQGRRTWHVPPSLPPLDFQSKIKDFCHPTRLKIRFTITVNPPPKKKKWAKSKLRCFNKLCWPSCEWT